jgi:hypothetical protein
VLTHHVIGRPFSWRVTVIIIAFAGLVLSIPSCTSAPVRGPSVDIVVLSTRADLVTGSDALVQLSGLPSSEQSMQILLNGESVRDEFARRQNGRFEGLLKGLKLGRNLLEARLPGGAGAQLVITDHPISGPLFSGPQIQPWSCQPGDSDAQCDHATEYSFLYYSSSASVCAQPGTLQPYQPHSVAQLGSSAGGPEPCFAPYDPASPPVSVPTVTTDEGVTVPYVIRLERLWQDRDEVDVAVLAMPRTNFEPWASSDPAWNRDLEITQGEACGDHHGEAAGDEPPALIPDSPPPVTDTEALADGFMVMSTDLNNSYHDCDLVLQAESLVIAKEHIVDEYGPINFTVGNGCSGGSLSQNQVANAFPGIYQGLITSCTFPDAFSTSMDVVDCDLLLRYWNSPGVEESGMRWTAAEEVAAAGKQSTKVCNSWINQYPFYPTLQPTLEQPSEDSGGTLNFQNCGVPPEFAYDPATNKGVRCDLEDYMVDVLGRSKATGNANSVLDNVGVEYGLQALDERKITAAQFVSLNESIGSFNSNFEWKPGRMAASQTGLRNAYRSGAVNEATYLNEVAIIDTPIDVQDIHEPYRSFAIRARLDAAHGSRANQVIWYTTAKTPNPFAVMNVWLTRVNDDHRPLPFAKKLVLDKPSAAHDMINRTYNEGTREAAGGPLASDVLACSLQPLRRSSFSVAFTSAQWVVLRATFPDGVCNWNKPGLEQQPTIPWLTYTKGPGGQPLGPPPQSTPLESG